MPFIQNLLSNIRGVPQVEENDFVIFVVGPTGSGKSWFTKEFCKHAHVQVVEGGQKVSTKYVNALRCNVGRCLYNVIVVDTPSFHTELGGFDAEKVMTDWVKLRLTKECGGSCILFLHPLVRDPTHHDVLMMRHLETFSTTFPNGFAVPSCVYVLPTKEPAAIIPQEGMNRQLSKLERMIFAMNDNSNGKWRVSMFREAFNGRPETAADAVQLLLREIGAECYQARPTGTHSRTNSKHNCPDSVNNSPSPTRGHSRKETNNDSDEMIRSKRAALQFIPPGHPRRCSALIDLGNLLNEQHGKQGQQGGLGEVIALKRAALELIPLDAPGRIAAVVELTNLISRRFREDPELDEIVMLRRIALELTPPGHPDRFSALINLANPLLDRS